MKKPNAYQAMYLANKLREQGYKTAETVPLEVWLNLGFLVTPTSDLQAMISEYLIEYGE